MQIKNSLIFSTLFLCTLLMSACGGGEPSSAQNDVTTPTTEPTSDNPKVITKSNSDADPEEEKKEEATEETEKGGGNRTVEEEPQVEEAPKKEEKKTPAKRAKMKFDEQVYDYGFVMQGDTVYHDFYFKNIGNDDLLITRVEPSCGCTVPIYPREPIPPGKGGKISVMFKSAGKLGRQVPNISVFTNYKRKIKLELKGYVDAERAKPAAPKKEEKKDTLQ